MVEIFLWCFSDIALKTVLGNKEPIGAPSAAGTSFVAQKLLRSFFLVNIALIVLNQVFMGSASFTLTISIN